MLIALLLMVLRQYLSSDSMMNPIFKSRLKKKVAGFTNFVTLEYNCTRLINKLVLQVPFPVIDVHVLPVKSYEGRCQVNKRQ